MDARSETPESINFVNPLIFKFQIKKTPTINYYVQSVNIPGISMQTASQPNPFVKIPYGGDHLQFEDLVISYKVDEDLKNYLELHNWVRSIGFPDNYRQHKQLSEKPRTSGEGLTSDISLVIMNNSRVPTFEVVYRDAFPVAVSSLMFDTTQTDVQFLEASATFQYVSFSIQSVNGPSTSNL
jgi:hypothetical protein